MRERDPRERSNIMFQALHRAVNVLNISTCI